MAKYKSKKKIRTESGEMTVYEYSDRQIANRHKEKAKRYEKLKGKIGDLRSKVKRDLKSSSPETKLTALAVALMDHTYERVGNDESAKDGHFGVTGWQRKHLSFGKKTTINYVGKSGVKHKKEVTDAALKRALKDAYEAVEGDDTEILSWEGGKVSAEKVNAYLKEFGVTAKDLRGFHANAEMQARLKAVRKDGGKLPEDKKAREKQLKEEFKKALEETADIVGHEPATLRSQYLVPNLESDYVDNGKIDDSFVKKASSSLAARVVVRYLGLHGEDLADLHARRSSDGGGPLRRGDASDLEEAASRSSVAGPKGCSLSLVQLGQEAPGRGGRAIDQVDRDRGWAKLGGSRSPVDNVVPRARARPDQRH